MNTFNPKKRKVLKYKEFLATGAKSEKAKNREKGEHEITKKAMGGEKKGGKGVATLDAAIAPEFRDAESKLSEAGKKEISFLVDGKFVSWYEILMEAFEGFKKQYDNWAFDERDEGDRFQEFVEKLIDRSMTKAELADKTYVEADKQATEIDDAATNIGYSYRTQGQNNPKAGEKADKNFEKVKNKYPNF